MDGDYRMPALTNCASIPLQPSNRGLPVHVCVFRHTVEPEFQRRVSNLLLSCSHLLRGSRLWVMQSCNDCPPCPLSAATNWVREEARGDGLAYNCSKHLFGDVQIKKMSGLKALALSGVPVVNYWSKLELYIEMNDLNHFSMTTTSPNYFFFFTKMLLVTGGRS